MDGTRRNKSPSFRRLWYGLYLIFLLVVVCGFYVVYSSAHGNFREVIPEKVYRSAQPSPGELREWAERYGLRTVINLRGDEAEEVRAEKAVAEELGLKMISMTLSSHRLSARYLIVELLQTLETVETPVLIHCHSGIDRAGTAGALAAMAIGHVHYEKAKWQAYVAPGPWKRKKYKNRRYFRDYSHISDVLRLYERYCRKNKLQTNDLQQLKQWVTETNELPEVEPK
jgi:protein tyrosine phosphatase (PTP) superfamily phosphohydrolase (DUF442 family)